MRELLDFIDEHGLFAAALFLLIFIPLYPKIPLFEAIPGYLVRVRLEDLFIGMTGVLWLIQVLRKKAAVNLPILALVIGYAAVGLVSLLVAIFLQQTIPLQALHIGKSVLHYFRYLEYFAIFFFLYSGVKHKLHAKIALASLVLSTALISIYGFGQKYLAWPVYSTMNREASKGVAQTLDAGARVHATFGGHYDLAAYLVIVLPILLALILLIKSANWRIKLITSLVFLSGVYLLLLSASKMAFLAFLVAIAIVLGNKFINCLGLKKTLQYGFGLGVLGIIFLSLFLLTIGSKYKESLINKITDSEITSSQFDSTWSENTRKYGLSMGIRLDTLWPQALYGFSLNPWTGKGYATLNKLALGEFTESDSTDNNYLRTLGETGILGFFFFSAILFYLLVNIIQTKSKNNLISILRLGFIASFFGLLVNALIIDVFAASKVAFSFWALSALVLKATRLETQNKFELQDKKLLKSWFKKFKNNYLLIFLLIIFILLFHKIPFSEHSPIQSFASNQDSAINVSAAICLSKNLFSCQSLISRMPVYDLPYVIYLLPFYFIFSHPSMYYFANLVLGIFIINIIYIFSKKLKFYKTLHKLFLIFILLILIIFNKQMFNIILNNFRDGYDAQQYRAVKRMNTLANSLSKENSNINIISYLNPDFINLFKDSDYQILELKDNLQISNYSDLYFSSATKKIQAEADIKTTLEFSKNHALQLETIDCEQRCNIFKVLPQKLELTSAAITANKKTFTTQEDYKIILASNKFARFFNSKDNLPTVINRYKNIFNNLNPDAFIFVGTSNNNAEVDHGMFFKQGFIDAASMPIIYAISDHADDSYGPAWQRFILNDKLFLILDDNLEDPKNDQKKLFFDTLLQLYQHAEIKDLIIISNSLDWTEQLTSADKKVAAQYANSFDINWHILADASSTGKSPEEALSFIQKDFNYTNTYFGEEPVNKILILNLSQDGVSVESKQLLKLN